MGPHPSLYSSPQAAPILFWIPGGMSLMLDVEGSLAQALQLRGVPLHAVICDGTYRACIVREACCKSPVSSWGEPGSSVTGMSCKDCSAAMSQKLQEFGVPYSFVGDYLAADERTQLMLMSRNVSCESLEQLTVAGVMVGRNVKSSIVRYLKGMPLDDHVEVVCEYAYSALVCAVAAAKAISRLAPQRIFMSHGVYVDWGPALQVAFAMHVPVSAWMGSYLTARFYFRNVEDNLRIDFHNMSQSAWGEVKRSPFTVQRDQQLQEYFTSRYRKRISFDMQNLQECRGESDYIRSMYRLDQDRPVWGVMSHINWDAVVDASPMAYADLDAWMLDTINELLTINNVQWLIKVHPAESWLDTECGVRQLIEEHFPILPPHITIVPADADINPLDFLNLLDGAVTGYGTAGLELLLQGKPVILAGEAHYGGKGFTHDGLTPESYRQLLRKAATLPQLSPDQLLLAKKYAYCYFIQRQIPFLVVHKPGADWWEFQPQKAHLLEPGQDPFIDFICERILDGQDFIMSEELVQLAEQVSEGERVLAETAGEQISTEGVPVLMEQASQAIAEDNLLRAHECFTRVLSEHAASLEPAMRDELKRWVALLADRLAPERPPLAETVEQHEP